MEATISTNHTIFSNTRNCFALLHHLDVIVGGTKKITGFAWTTFAKSFPRFIVNFEILPELRF